jgi:hypothetical protein
MDHSAYTLKTKAKRKELINKLTFMLYQQKGGDSV